MLWATTALAGTPSFRKASIDWMTTLVSSSMVRSPKFTPAGRFVGSLLSPCPGRSIATMRRTVSPSARSAKIAWASGPKMNPVSDRPCTASTLTAPRCAGFSKTCAAMVAAPVPRTVTGNENCPEVIALSVVPSGSAYAAGGAEQAHTNPADMTVNAMRTPSVTMHSLLSKRRRLSTGAHAIARPARRRQRSSARRVLFVVAGEQCVADCPGATFGGQRLGRDGVRFPRASGVGLRSWTDRGEQIRKIVRVVLFVPEDLLEHAAARGVVLAEPPYDLSIDLDDDALRDEVLLDHLGEHVARAVFGRRSRDDRRRVEVGIAPELIDSLCDEHHVHLFVVGVFRELRGDLRVVDALRDDLVVSVPQDAEDLGGKRLVQEIVGARKVERVVHSDRATEDRLPGVAPHLIKVIESVRFGLRLRGCHPARGSDRRATALLVEALAAEVPVAGSGREI